MVTGFMATKDGDPATSGWELTSAFGYLDSTIQETYLPDSEYEFIMDNLMQASIGYYFDTDLDSYVMSCNQFGLMPKLHIKFETCSNSECNNWYHVSPDQYLHSIDDTGFCEVALRRNTADEWILGTDFMMGYNVEFAI